MICILYIEKEAAMRALIEIPERQIDELTIICQAKKLSRSEAIRQAIAYYVANNKPSSSQAFGLWTADNKAQKDGLAYQEKVRAEW